MKNEHETISVYVRFRDNGGTWAEGSRLRSPTHIALTLVPTSKNEPVYVRIKDYIPRALDTTQTGRNERIWEVVADLPAEFHGLRYMSARDMQLATQADSDSSDVRTDFVAEAVTESADEPGVYW